MFRENEESKMNSDGDGVCVCVLSGDEGGADKIVLSWSGNERERAYLHMS